MKFSLCQTAWQSGDGHKKSANTFDTFWFKAIWFKWIQMICTAHLTISHTISSTNEVAVRLLSANEDHSNEETHTDQQY